MLHTQDKNKVYTEPTSGKRTQRPSAQKLSMMLFERCPLGCEYFSHMKLLLCFTCHFEKLDEYWFNGKWFNGTTDSNWFKLKLKDTVRIS